MKRILKRVVPKPFRFLYRIFRDRKDTLSIISFLIQKKPNASFLQRVYIIKQMYLISYFVECPHTQYEALSFIKTILSLPPETKGCIVEAGSYKGGGTSKFSLAAKTANRKLVVFDSFEGIPAHTEYPDKFPEGSYLGSLDEVKRNVKRFGAIEMCEFVKGWFEETMPNFSESVSAVYLDVDLASSTKTCLKHLYPLLTQGGTLFSQDCHLPLVVNIFNDADFWKKEIGSPKPVIEGLGKQKLIKMQKIL